MNQRTRRLAAIAAVGLGVTLPVAVANTVHAATDVYTASIDLSTTFNTSGGGTLPGFDSSLGTLTQVDVSMSVDVTMSLCIENNNSEGGADASGEASASVDLTSPAGVILADTYEMTIAPAPVAPYDNTDDCAAAFDATSARFTSTPAADDLVYLSQSDTLSDDQTITDPSALEAYIVPTVAYDYEGMSLGDASVGSEWDIWFVAYGQGTVTVTYTYEPTSTTTTNPGESTTTNPAQTTSTTQPRTLPRTGAESGQLTGIALMLTALGGAALLASRRLRAQ